MQTKQEVWISGGLYSRGLARFYPSNHPSKRTHGKNMQKLHRMLQIAFIPGIEPGTSYCKARVLITKQTYHLLDNWVHRIHFTACFFGGGLWKKPEHSEQTPQRNEPNQNLLPVSDMLPSL